MELLFQDSLVILPEEAGYPERFQSVSLEELGFASLVEPYTAVNLSDPRRPGMSADMCDYLQGLGSELYYVFRYSRRDASTGY
jgi:hypothetical protein